ncbi:hypothetical protein [Pseudoalteromonas ardens]|uniref:hypothetical protein n=1 Tax=Pseudoalteromonas ardens TaxID=3048490 RepID=UPI0024C29489|nr:hypothetical protein [Pseudoalteromonas sp. R96]MDK1312884.1 hypothetical protein [Pseudoalteromonas sp. R96]
MDNSIANLGSPEQQQQILEAQKRNQLRNQINYHIADTGTLVGTATDISHILLNELSGFVNKLAVAENLDEVKASVASMKAAIGDIEGQVATGELTFPYQSKGLDTVKLEIIERANGVNNLL